MKNRVFSMLLAALFAALTAIGALLKIPIGPAPITLQFFFTALAGIVLGPYLGALSQLIYVLLGIAGVPLFTTGGGLSYLFHPTFGYLIGFILAPIVIGKVSESAKAPAFLRIFGGCLLGILVIYAVGVPYLYIILRYVNHTGITFLNALVIGFLVFLPGDLVKSALVALLGKKLVPILKRSGFLLR